VASISEALQGDVLNATGNAVFQALTTRRLPPLLRVGTVLGDSVRGHHFQAWSRLPHEQDVFDKLGMTGSFHDPGQGDVLAVLQANAAPNKLDAYIERQVDYQVHSGGDNGTTVGRLTISLRNTATANIDPRFAGNDLKLPNGTARLRLRVVTPLGLQSARVGDTLLQTEDLPGARLHDYAAFVEIPPGGRTTVVMDLMGNLGPGPYHLTVLSRPSTISAQTHVEATEGKRAPEPSQEGYKGVTLKATTTDRDLDLAFRNQVASVR
jgi:hypothetical protein